MLVLSACSKEDTTALEPETSAPENQIAASLVTSLANAHYPFEDANFGVINLEDGVFEQKLLVEGESALKVVLVAEHTAWGDLNADGKPDAVTILVSNSGDSGSFYYLTAALNIDAVMNPLATKFLGDRLLIDKIVIDANGIINLNLLTRAENEPMTATPTKIVTQQFKLVGEELVEIK